MSSTKNSQNSPHLSLEQIDAFNLRPTRLIVDVKSIISNLKIIKKMCKTDILAVVKADCYGLGAVEICKAISKEKIASIFGIATLYEGIELRNNGIKEKILLLGALSQEEFEECLKYRITPTIYSFSSLNELSRLSEKLKRKIVFHLKVDSGMGRLGFLPHQLKDVLKVLMNSPFLEIEGIFSNLSSADEVDSDKTCKQLEVFLKMVDYLKENHIKLKYTHLANSSGAIFHPNTRLNLIRPGISMYGLLPQESLSLKELTLSVKLETKIVQIKNMPPNSEIGYGATYKTRGGEKIAVLPIGYADGLPRLLGSEGGMAIVKGKKVPFRGRISMDLSVISVEGIKVSEGDKVTLWGKEGEEEITPYDWAKWAKTIPYEILTKIGKRVARFYIK